MHTQTLQPITNNSNHTINTTSFTQERLTARWVIVDGKLVCQWIIG
ncbi:hypothetical protein IFO70_36430 [Phormidium tenue FACHB-886]|nr:hypothetical protein [Phormidium tenue FACHB-886]